MAKEEALDDARQMVYARRCVFPSRTTHGSVLMLRRRAAHDPNTVDLHGTTVYEATTLVRELLHSCPPSACASPGRRILHPYFLTRMLSSAPAEGHHRARRTFRRRRRRVAPRRAQSAGRGWLGRERVG